MSSYPKTSVTFTAGAAATYEMNDQAFGTVGRVVFQVVTAGGFNGAIRVNRRIQGAGRQSVTVPWVRSAYRNEAGQADVNNSTDITAAGLYSIWCDGTDVQLANQASGDEGTATILFHGLVG